MKSILEELFYGNVCPNTDCRNYEQETKELMGDLSGHYDTLLNELNDKQKEILKKLMIVIVNLQISTSARYLCMLSGLV